MRLLRTVAVFLSFSVFAQAVSRPHVMSFGKATTVKLLLGPSEEKELTVTVRPLFLDTKLKEYTTGPVHEITDRVFVVRRAYRVNDSLPSETSARWLWQRGGWLLVDRTTGRITQLKLPEFDPYYSDVSWYRDYAAYCGVADDGERVSVVVTQITAKKPLYKKHLQKLDGELPAAVRYAPVAAQARTCGVRARCR